MCIDHKRQHHAPQSQDLRPTLPMVEQLEDLSPSSYTDELAASLVSSPLAEREKVDRDFHAGEGNATLSQSPSWVTELALERSSLLVESEGLAWSQFSYADTPTTTYASDVADTSASAVASTTSTTTVCVQPEEKVQALSSVKSLFPTCNAVTAQLGSSWVGELALDTSGGLGVELEGSWSQFSHVASESDFTSTFTEQPIKEQQQSFSLKLAPEIPEPDEWSVGGRVTNGKVTNSDSSPTWRLTAAVAPLPSFDPAELRRHKYLLARMAATRAGQQLYTATTGKVTGCVCTDQTCASYFRLENEAAELLMLEGAQRAVKALDITAWNTKYVGQGQVRTQNPEP